MLAENMDRIMQFRDAHPELADRFVDVHYHELVADPLGTLRRIYQRLGAALPDRAATAMRNLALTRNRYVNGEHGRPSLEELGLDASTENRRFAAYCSRFRIVRSRA